MLIRSKFTTRIFLPYGGLYTESGAWLDPHQPSGELPATRYHNEQLQRDLQAGRIEVVFSEGEKSTLTHDDMAPLSLSPLLVDIPTGPGYVGPKADERRAEVEQLMRQQVRPLPTRPKQDGSTPGHISKRILQTERPRGVPSIASLLDENARIKSQNAQASPTARR